MESENDKLIREQFAQLPKELQKALETVKWKEAVKDIARTNNLNEDNSGNLERETMFILYGFEAPEDYASNMVRELGIGEVVANKIAQEVDDKIFKVISEMIEKGEEKKEVPPTSLIPEIPPNILPAVEPGEVAHEVPHQEPAPLVAETSEPTKDLEPKKLDPTPAPKPAYPGGADPYREPLD